MKSAVEKRILIFAFIVLTLTLAVNTGLNIEGFRRDYRDGLVLRCQSQANGFKTSIEKVLALGIPLAEMDGINARCQEIIAADPEIAYCLVESATGEILYSNDPSFHLSAGADFVGGSGSTAVLMFFPNLGTAYNITSAINGPDGRIAGRVHLGFSAEIIDTRISRMLGRTVMVLLAALIVVFGVVVIFTKRNLVTPIRQLCNVARQITSGEFRVTVPPMSTRDFDELGGALREMANSLSERDRKIQENYAELELANRELQQSYEQQERISAELAHSREMYRVLLEDAGDATLVVDEEDRIVLINKAFESFFCLPRADTIGRNLFYILERLQCDRLEQQYELFRRILLGEALELELNFRRPGEEQRIVGWLRGSPVVGPDGKRMIQATVRDITHDQEIKQNLEKIARDLQSLNEMKDSFLGMASHELKTPLTVIIGYAELILGETAGKADKTVLAMVQYIVDAAERLSSIVRDMVDVSMLDRKQLPLRKRNIDINDLVQAAAREMEYFFQVRNQTLHLQMSEQLPPVSCDPDRIFQVLSNLIGNAVKFTPDGGNIYIETRLTRNMRWPNQEPSRTDQVLIDTHQHSYLELCVRDTGIGIAETDQAQIFEKFFEVGKIEEHFTGKMAFKGKGTGLGLTIVKGIVDMHGGAIWVESPGYDPVACPGSTFHLLLPIINNSGFTLVPDFPASAAPPERH